MKNIIQGSQIEVTEDREAVLDCVSPGGKPAPDVRDFFPFVVFGSNLFCLFFTSFARFIRFTRIHFSILVFLDQISFSFLALNCVPSDVRVLHLEIVVAI